MARWRRTIALVIAAGACTAAGRASDETPRGAIERANELFRSARFSEAAEAYAKVETDDPAVTPDLLHNQAAAAFKLGDYAKARDLWVRAATMKDAAFEASARYNLGNCAYHEALDKLAPASGDPETPAQPPLDEVTPLVERAIEQYQDALRLDPSLLDARANLELAAQLLEKLNENSTSQPQSQPDSQPQSQPDSQPESQPSSQPQDGQQGDGSDSQSQSQPSSQPDSQPSSSPSTQPEPSSQPQDQNGEPEEGEDEPQSQPSPGEEPKPDTQPVTQPASRPSPQSQPGEEGEEKPQGEAEETDLPPVKLTPEQAERLLQKVRDAEKARREALRARDRGRQKPVERDW